MDSLIQDIRYALRGLLRSPGFTIAVVLTLALGIGANTTMFGVVDTLFLRPPAHVVDASRVQRVYFRVNFMGTPRINAGTSFPGYESLRGVPGLARVAAMSGGQMSVGSGPDARQVRVRAVTSSFFPLLGVRAERGRLFDSTDDRLGAAPVAVVSHAYWQREMAGDGAVLGRTITLGSFAYTVIGVAPEDFTGADFDEPDLWLPIRQAAPLLVDAEALTSRNWFWVTILARLAPGAAPAGAASQATLMFRRAAVGGGNPMDTSAAVVLGPIQLARGPQASSDSKVARWVAAVALLVLLVACANVANLLLARGLRRRTEMAVRAGLGAGRARLVRQLVVESLVLALAGGIAALLVALWGGSAVRAYLLPKAVGAAAPVFDLRILAFTAAVSILAGLLAGSAPAWHSSRTDISLALRSGGRDVTRTRGLLRSTLLATQVALTLVLLVGAGLFVRSLRYAQTLDYGLDLEHLLVAGVPRGGSSVGRVLRTDAPTGPSDPQSALYLRLMDRIRTNPAVASAAVVVGTPYQSSISLSLRASGRDSLPSVEGGGPYVMSVSPAYFATVGTRILRGRGFTDQDVKGALPVTVVGQTFAKMVWPDRDAIGQCLYIGRDSSCIQVVGIAADARSRTVLEDKTLMYYVPFAQRSQMPIDGLLIRTRGAARAAQGEIQHALQNAEAGVPFVRVDPLLDRVEPQWRSWRLGATMLTAFGLLALMIASLGLYGVTAYGVTQRTQEIGVRVALGAQRADVIRLSVAQAVRATTIGAAIGLAIAFALGRAVASLLFGVKPADPAALLAGVAVLLAVAAVAAWIPARRAARIDPMEALRYE